MAVMPSPSPPVVTDHPERHRYEITVDGVRVGLLTYTRSTGVITMLHAEIDPGRGGEGLGTALARGALQDARAQGLSVRPVYPFVAALIARHPDEFADLVA